MPSKAEILTLLKSGIVDEFGAEVIIEAPESNNPPLAAPTPSKPSAPGM